jgi:hypothetical protein
MPRSREYINEETVWYDRSLVLCDIGENYLNGKRLGAEEKYCKNQNLRSVRAQIFSARHVTI